MKKIVEDMQWRYACKKFDPIKKLASDDVESLLESLRLTASSFGLQPWSFVHVKNTALREELVGACYGQEQVKDASDLIILCAKSEFTENDVDAYINNLIETRDFDQSKYDNLKKMLMYPVNWDEQRRKIWMEKQIYIALGTLLTACATMRIDSCPMEGFVAAKVDKILDLTNMGLRSVLVCPIGYRASDDSYANLAKVRFPKSEIIKILS